MRTSVCAIFCVAAALAGESRAEQGVRGRAAFGGVLVEGVVVTAYPYRPGSFGPVTGVQPTARASTDTDGTYRIPLPPGQYVLEGLHKAEGNQDPRPETGDLHCLYGGSPVSVMAEAWTGVGLNLSRVLAESRKPGDRAALMGRITYEGELVEKVYLYVYSDAATAFRGPAWLLQPVAKGEFRVRLPPGGYHLVARKRAQGGPYGPVDVGDLFNFYARNPVVVAQGEEVSVEIPLVARLSQLEEEPGAFQGLEVRVLEPSGAPAEGYRVLAYPSAFRSGPPLAASPATGADGRTLLPLPPGRNVFLRARRSLGGPLAEGELAADAETSVPAPGELVLRLGVRP